MASVSGDQNSKLDAELNLVPFIDLLSTLVLFLLVTAVWLQVATVPASVDSKGRAAVTKAESEKVSILLTRDGYRISWPSWLKGRGLPELATRGQSNMQADRLAQVLKKALQANDKRALPIVSVAADDDVPYERVIQAIDAVKEAGISSVALSTG